MRRISKFQVGVVVDWLSEHTEINWTDNDISGVDLIMSIMENLDDDSEPEDIEKYLESK